MIRQWREKVQEPFEEYQEKVKAWWLALAPREKLILSVAAGIASLLMLALVAKQANDLVLQTASTSETNYQNIEKIQKVASEIQVQRTELRRYEELRGKRGGSFKLQSFLEREASNFNVSIAKVTPTKARDAEKPNAQEEWLEIQTKEATLDNIIKFLQSAEETLGLRVVELSIKPSFSNASRLEMTAVIAGMKEL